MLQAIVLTKNSSDLLKKCLPNLKFADSILVIDDYSDDDTIKVAESFGAKVIKRHLAGNFASQRNFALTKTKADWVLFVDPDEIIPPKLQAEIKQVIKQNRPSGYFLRRLDYFKSQPLHHGDTGNFKVLRLQKKPFTIWEGMVHEIWTAPVKTSTLKNYLFHYSHPTIYSFLHSINQYSEIRAQELYSQKKEAGILDIIFYPIFKFLHLYLLKLGFLDGIVGLIHALMMSFYSFLVRGKLFMLWRHASPPI